MKRLLKAADSILLRLGGLLGGLVCAVAVCTATLYCYAVFRFPFLIVVATGLIVMVLCGVLGLLWPRYFGLFVIPIFNAMANDDGHDHCDDGRPWKVGLASVSLLLGLIALVIGTVFQFHVIFAIGAVMVLGYAIWAPWIFAMEPPDAPADGT